jgi:hypothetical protein
MTWIEIWAERPVKGSQVVTKDPELPPTRGLAPKDRSLAPVRSRAGDR